MKKNKVLVGGCFDIFHYGHVYFLKKAKALGDFLIIALESDVNVRKLKGPGRPIHAQSQRKEILESMSFVDKVVTLPQMKNDKDYEKLVVKVSPQIIAVTKGDKMIGKKRDHAKKVGAKVIEIQKFKGSSTSKIASHLADFEF